MNAAHDENLAIDLHKIIIGDLLNLTKGLCVVVHEPTRAGHTTPFVAHEDTLDTIIQSIATYVGLEQFSLDVRTRGAKMAVISVRIYDRAIPIEGLI